MSANQWTVVDRFLMDLLLDADAALDAALEASANAGLPPINVSPLQGKLLHLLARAQGARRILEIGTLGGYSAIWLARALPSGGRLVTLEAEPSHAAVARVNIARAGLEDRVEVRTGRAQETLPQLHAEQPDPFDLVFIDADKPGYPDYFRWALRLTQPGSLIVADNVVRNGTVVDPQSPDPSIQGIRRFLDLLAAESRAGRVTATAIQTVSNKGYDGFAIASVTSRA